MIGFGPVAATPGAPEGDKHLDGEPTPRERPSSMDPTPSNAGTYGRVAALPARIAVMIEGTASGIRRRSLGPIELASRLVALVIVITAMALTALVLVAVGLVRLLDAYLFPGEVWASYALIGGLFTLAGVLAHFKASSLGARSDLPASRRAG